MSLENTWDKMDAGQDKELNFLLDTVNLKKLPSHNPLSKIKKALLYNVIWGVLICMLYIFGLFYLSLWQVQLAILVVFGFSVWAVYTAFQQYKSIDTGISAKSSLLVEMKRHYASIINWMHLQQRVALFIYPISAAGGFMLGGAEGSGKPISEFMTKPFFIITLLIALLVLVPACYYLAKWMFKISFGKHLKALNKNIQELENEK